MAITFHADLLDTTLEDFDSHFRVPLNFIGGFMRGQQGVPPIVFHDMRTEEFIEDKYNLVFPDISFPNGYTDYENAKKVLTEESRHYRAAIESISRSMGYIQVVCSVRGPRITYEAMLLATVTNGKVQIDEQGKVYFMLYVARYRQNRLKLLLGEADAEKKPYAKLFEDWLEPRWGDAVQILPVEDAPPLYEEKSSGRPRIAAHANAIERLHKGENKTVNFNKWQTEYEKETGTHPSIMDSGASELYRKNVWQPFNEIKGGKN
jgi:hypothetical protein